MKKYKSNSNISFNVSVNGKRVHISFDPITSGGSEFITSDKTLQEALEKSYLFGNSYTLDEDNSSEEENDENLDGVDDTTLNDVEEINNLDDAKSFLIEKGVSEDTLNTKAAIKKAAKSIGFNFPNLK